MSFSTFLRLLKNKENISQISKEFSPLPRNYLNVSLTTIQALLIIVSKPLVHSAPGHRWMHSFLPMKNASRVLAWYNIPLLTRPPQQLSPLLGWPAGIDYNQKFYVGTSIARYGPRHTKFQLPSLKPFFALYTLYSTTPFVCGHLHSKYGPQHKLTSIFHPSSNKTRTLFILCLVPDPRLPTFY